MTMDVKDRPMDGYEVFHDGNSYVYESQTDSWRITKRLDIWPYIKVIIIPYTDKIV